MTLTKQSELVAALREKGKAYGKAADRLRRLVFEEDDEIVKEAINKEWSRLICVQMEYEQAAHEATIHE